MATTSRHYARLIALPGNGASFNTAALMDKLTELFYVLCASGRTQAAVAAGLLFFIGVQLLGAYVLGDFELTLINAEANAAVKAQFDEKYDKIAWGGLLSLLALAYKHFRKAHKRLFYGP